MLVGLASLTLVGCAGRPIQPGSFIKSVPAEQAMVMPPPAGPAIVSVIERRYNNAITQDIHLATSASTPGQNLLRAQFFGTESPFSYTENNLGSRPVTEASVAKEMRELLPRVRMARSQFYVQNNYGPFGYAFGRGMGGDLCLYAWQQIRSRAAQMSPVANYGSIQIRLRMCEAGATEAKLLSIMYNFTINASVDAPGWNPYGNARPFNPDVGGSGAPIYPRPTSSEPIVQSLPPRQSIAFAPAVSAVKAQSATGTTTAPSPASPTGPQALVPGPRLSAIPVPEDSSVERPAVPSPGTVVATAPPRVTVPSPSCTTTTDGADVVCR